MLGVADHAVQMLTAGKIAMIPREEIDRITTARPAVGRAMWIDTLVDGAIFREWIANVGRRNAKTRLAHVLCAWAKAIFRRSNDRSRTRGQKKRS